jgi:hypothetical protein
MYRRLLRADTCQSVLLVFGVLCDFILSSLQHAFYTIQNTRAAPKNAWRDGLRLKCFFLDV